jgi:hypothetical protein
MKRLILPAVALLLAGCGGAPATATSPAASPAARQPPPLAFPMNGVGAANAGITGTVTIQKHADGQGFTITVDLKGMVPNTIHVSHIHKGSCADNGAIAIPLPNSLTADASGHATATNEISSPYPGTGFYANVHTGPDLSSAANAAPCACGDLADTAP